MNFTKYFPWLMCLIVFTGCLQPGHTGNSYTRSEMGRVATVMRGIIISIREVDIQGSSNAGALAGGTTGAVGGSYVGGDTGSNIVGAVAGAVAGAVVGAATEQSLTQSKASEFIIEQENNQVVAIVQTNEENLTIGDKVLILRSGKARVIKTQ